MCPIYDFDCETCNEEFVIYQSILEYNGRGECPACKNISTKRIISSKVHFIGAKVEDAEYNPAFGKIVKNKYHRSELAKQYGCEEIGNQNPERMHDEFAKDRTKKFDKRWDEV